MDIKIKVVSAFDNKKNAASYLYVAETESDKGDSIKILKHKENVFSINNKARAESIASNELESFVYQLKDEFDIENINIYAHPNSLENKWFKKNHKDENTKFKKEFNAKKFMELTQKLFANLFNADISKTLNNDFKPSPVRAFKKEPNDLSTEDLDGFITRLNKKEKLLRNIFDSKVLNNKNIDNVFIDFAFTQDVERKRYGYGIEVYSNIHNLRIGKDPIFRQQLIGHGELNEGIDKLKNALIEKTNKILKTEKNITLNISTPHRNLAGQLHGMKKEGIFSKNIEISTVRSTMHDKTEKMAGNLIEKDIKLHLEKIKDPETVAIWTDGSVNAAENYSGTGILIRHQGKEEEFSLKNDKGTDNTYAEFKGVYESLKKVATDEQYKGKKVIIISDNDSMSQSIRKRLKKEACSQQPFLDDICTLFTHFDIDVNFHNVKSHVHEKIKAEDKESLYDFYYNNVVDDLARIGAGLKNKADVKKELNARKKQRVKQRQKAANN